MPPALPGIASSASESTDMSPTLPGSANSIPEVVDATSISPTMSFDLLRLPNELKDKIPEFLVGDTVTLDALSRTCRYLRYKCPTERFLYHSVVFDERSISGRARARQLLSSIVARPKLATYIRSYAVKDSDPLQKRAHPDTYYKDSSWKATNAIYGEIASLIPEIRAKLLELYGNPGATNSGAQQQRVWIDQALGICRLAGFAGVSALVVHLSPYIERIEVANSRHMDLINNTFCYIDLIERLFKEDNNKSALHKLLGITIRPSEYIYLNPPVRLPMLPAIHGDGVVTVPCLPTIEALTIHGHVRHVRHLQLHPEPSSAPHNLRHLSLYDIRVETSNLEAIIRTGALGKLALIVMHDVELEWHDFERLVDAMALHLPMLEELQCTYFNEWPSPTRGNPMSFEKLEQVRILRIDSRVLLDLQFYYTWPTEFEEEDWVNLNKIKQHLTTTRLPPHADVVHIGSMPLKMLRREVLPILRSISAPLKMLSLTLDHSDDIRSAWEFSKEGLDGLNEELEGSGDKIQLYREAFPEEIGRGEACEVGSTRCVSLYPRAEVGEDVDTQTTAFIGASDHFKVRLL